MCISDNQVLPLIPKTCNSEPDGAIDLAITCPLDVVASRLIAIFDRTGRAGKHFWVSLSNFEQLLVSHLKILVH